MEISNKKRLFWLIIIFLILVSGFLSFYWMGKSNKIETQNIVYSNDTTEIKKELVPSDFPLPVNGVTPSQEFQREINGHSEYTLVWDSPFSIDENRKTFEDYLTANGWNPISMEMGPKIISITGQKDDVVLNINISGNSKNQTIEVQVHFSQK